jgi:hypothetical protein
MRCKHIRLHVQDVLNQFRGAMDIHDHLVTHMIFRLTMSRVFNKPQKLRGKWLQAHTIWICEY